MPKEMKLPELAESVVEGEILKWLVEEGQNVAQDQPVGKVMTDKVTVELPAPFPGRLEKRLVKEGDVVPIHTPIALFAEQGESAAPQADTQPAQAAPDQPEEVALGGEMSATESAVGSNYGTPQTGSKVSFAKPEKPQAAAPAGSPAPSGRVLAVPAARQAAREAGVDLAAVPGSGPNGRVGMDDIRAYLASLSHQPAAPSPSSQAQGGPARPQPAVAYRTPKGYEDREVRQPLHGLRRVIAQQMLTSHLSTVRTLTVAEADLTELVALRARLKPGAAAKGVKLTYLPFIAKAAVSALQRFPHLNSSLDESRNEIVSKSYYNLGVAVDTEAGLLVPVIHDVDRRSILDIAAQIEQLAAKAREGKLSAEESSGSSFSITNMGSAGSLLSFPIINVPDAAILGVHTIVERPVGRQGQVELRSMMYLSLSFDHRLVDGAEGARFLQDIVRLLEDPETLLLEAV
jgi:pyruvate dehydrogenase E2 component (dihydrolipoamide acetyltransferase)